MPKWGRYARKWAPLKAAKGAAKPQSQFQLQLPVDSRQKERGSEGERESRRGGKQRGPCENVADGVDSRTSRKIHNEKSGKL